jgi:exopolysaccharide production protein ExoQ
VATSKNTLGATCLCLGLGALWRFVTAYQDQKSFGRTRRMIARGAILLMALWLLYITNSMTALSSFLMAGTLLIVSYSRAIMRRPAIVHCLIAVMLAVSLSILFFGGSPDTLKTLGRDPTLTDRTDIWAAALRLVQNPFLGTGFESFWLGSRLDTIWDLFWFHPMQAHNGYLETFLNLGWAGVILLGVVLISGYRTSMRFWRSNLPDGNLKLAFLLAGLVFNFTEAAFFRIQATVSLFFLLAIIRVPKVSERIQAMPKRGTWFQESEPASAFGTVNIG